MKNRSLPVSGNTPSYRRHRRQFALQIVLPLLVVALLVLGAGGFLVAGSTAAKTRHLADVALIWLIVPLLLMGLIVASIGVAKIYLMARLLKTVPIYTAKGQELFSRFAHGVRSAADRAVLPVFKIHEFLAALQVLKRK
jgi:hypothetical protein